MYAYTHMHTHLHDIIYIYIYIYVYTHIHMYTYNMHYVVYLPRSWRIHGAFLGDQSPYLTVENGDACI